MIERLARGDDTEEDRAFNVIRRRFIEAAALNMDVGRGIAGVVAQPDHWFWHLMEQAVDAARAGQPQPHPWFIKLCSEMLAEGDGTREPPGEPTIN